MPSESWINNIFKSVIFTNFSIMAEKFIDDAKYFAAKGDVVKTQDYLRKARELNYKHDYYKIEKKIWSDANFNQANNMVRESEKCFEKNNPLSALVSLEYAKVYSVGFKQKLDIYRRIKIAKQKVISYHMSYAEKYSNNGEENNLEKKLMDIKEISLIEFLKVKEDLRYKCAESEFKFKLVYAKKKVEDNSDNSYYMLAVDIPSIQFHAEIHKIDFKSNELFNSTIDFLLAKEVERFNKLKEMLPTVEKSFEEDLHKDLFKSANILNQYSNRLGKKFDKGFEFQHDSLQLDEYSKIAPAMNFMFQE